MIYVQDTDMTLHQGDCLEVLRTLPDRSVHMCCTSPPFYGLRDYGTGSWEGGDQDCDHPHPKAGDVERNLASSTLAGTGQSHMANGPRDTCGKCGARRVDRQIGLEDTPDQWVARLVDVFREVRRVLRDDGTLWIEIGDSYAAGKAGRSDTETVHLFDMKRGRRPANYPISDAGGVIPRKPPNGTKPKDLLGQPWLLAFALRADGWYLRSEIIWNKPNPMPESVTDRPTKAHSTVFLLAKQPRYYFDADAIREAYAPESLARDKRARLTSYHPDGQSRRGEGERCVNGGANARSVWTVATEPTPFAHFATWPQKLCARMILAGTSEHGCCPQCGAPWVRETEVERVVRSQGGPSPSHTVVKGYSASSAMVTNALPKVTTLGWAPSCRHDHQPVPCTVLDPFGGSGTTALVARSLGRRSTLIELSGDYCALAARRLQQLSLFSEAAT